MLLHIMFDLSSVLYYYMMNELNDYVKQGHVQINDNEVHH
jgi:hypothetical protein